MARIMVLGVAFFFAHVAITLAQQPLNVGANLQGGANGQIQRNQVPPAQGNANAQGAANVQAGSAGAAVQGGANLQGAASGQPGNPAQGGAQIQGGANAQVPGAANLQGGVQGNANGQFAPPPPTFQGQTQGNLQGQFGQQGQDGANIQGQARTTTGYRGVEDGMSQTSNYSSSSNNVRRGPIARLLARLRNR